MESVLFVESGRAPAQFSISEGDVVFYNYKWIDEDDPDYPHPEDEDEDENEDENDWGSRLVETIPEISEISEISEGICIVKFQVGSEEEREDFPIENIEDTLVSAKKWFLEFTQKVMDMADDAPVGDELQFLETYLGAVATIKVNQKIEIDTKFSISILMVLKDGHTIPEDDIELYPSIIPLTD